MRSITKEVPVEIEGWEKMDLGHKKDYNKDEYEAPMLMKLVSKGKPINNPVYHQQVTLAIRLNVTALDVVCLLTCQMFTVFMLRWDMFYE